MKYCVFPKNFQYFATSPSQRPGCFWLYKKWPANKCDCTLRSDELISYMQRIGCSKFEEKQFLMNTLYPIPSQGFSYSALISQRCLFAGLSFYKMTPYVNHDDRRPRKICKEFANYANQIFM